MHNHSTALVDIISTIDSLCNEARVDEEIRPGPQAIYPHSLIVTILILKSLFGFNSESSFLRYLEKHHWDFFPSLPEQSWFNRKAKKLVETENLINSLLLEKLGVKQISIRIIDATGIPVVKLHRARKCRGFRRRSEVGFGYCAAKKSYYFGEKLTISVTPQGIPMTHVLTPANHHDLRALKENLGLFGSDLRGKRVVADKGYYDGDLETTLKASLNSKLIVPEKKRHQKVNSESDKKLLTKRQIVETVFEQLQDHMKIDHTKAKSQLGLMSRIQAILLSFTLGIYVNVLAGRDLLAIKSIVV